MVVAGELVREDYVGVSEENTVSELIGLLVKEGASEALVFDEEGYSGMVLPGSPLKSRMDSSEMKVRSVKKSVPVLRPDQGLEEVARLMFDSNSTALPVMDSKVRGIVHVFDVLKRLNEVEGINNLKVADVRHPLALTVKEDDRLGKAIQLMHDDSVDRMPVVDENSEMVGFLSHRDLLEKYYSQHANNDNGLRPGIETKAFRAERPDVMDLPVSNFMETSEPIIVEEDESLVNAGLKMADNQVLSLVLLKNGKPHRIITKRDLLEAVKESLFPEIQNIRYVGFEDLEVGESTKEEVEDIISVYAEKIGFMVKNEYEVVVHFKQYNEEGKRKKFSINARVSYPGATVAADRSAEWKITNAVHGAFQALMTSLSHKYKDEKKGRPTPRKDPESLIA